MIRLRPAATRGHFANGWLDARFSFSFGAYQDPAWDGWSDLQVLNEDRVAPGAGFGPHPHVDVEVMSWPVTGVVEHRDSLGHHALLRPGEVHLMRAGRGIVHSEMNASATEPEHHLQWWIRPAQTGLAPGYWRYRPDPEALRRGMVTLAGPEGAGAALPLAQDTVVHATRLQDRVLPLPLRRERWHHLHVVSGRLRVDGQAVAAGDGLFVTGEPGLTMEARGAEAELLWFDLRPGPG